MALADDFKRKTYEMQKLHILEFLRGQPTYVAATDVIYQYLTEQKFDTISMARLNAHLIMLAENGLVDLLADGTAARVTFDGIECANGMVHYPGVARPKP